MKRILLLMLLAAAVPAQAQQAPSPLVDRKTGTPMLLAFDVEPGYYKQVLIPTNEGDEEEDKTLRVHIAPPVEPEWTQGHWNPTVSLCLRPAEKSNQLYCANLDVDRTQAMRTFGVARLFSESGDTMFRKLTPTMFEPEAKVELQVVRKGEHVTTRFNGVIIDEGEVGFAPAFWVIGSSTGVATVEVVEEVEALLGSGEWPTTIEAAVALEIDYLSTNSKDTLRGMRKEELANFRVGWGTQLIERQGLSRGNQALMEAACGTECDPAAAAMVIMEAVWATFQPPAAQ